MQTRVILFRGRSCWSRLPATAQVNCIQRRLSYCRTSADRRSDEADFQRAVTAYRFWYPTVSCEGIFNGGREIGIKDSESVMIMSAGPRQVAFTANSDTPYGAGCLDLSSGPYRRRNAAGAVHRAGRRSPSGLDSRHGNPRPRRGQRWQAPDPAARLQGRTCPRAITSAGRNSNKVLIAVRSLPQNGDVQGAIDALRRIKIYPLVDAPPTRNW